MIGDMKYWLRSINLTTVVIFELISLHPGTSDFHGYY